MSTPERRPPTGFGRLLRSLAGAGGLASIAFAFAATHLPAPRAVGESEADPRRQAVRNAWHALGDTARRFAPLWPHVLDPLRSDKTIHVALFVGPGALFGLAMGRRLEVRRAALLLAGLSAWGALDELGQRFMGRDGEWGDWVANTVGAAIGIAVVAPVAAWRRRKAGGP